MELIAGTFATRSNESLPNSFHQPVGVGGHIFDGRVDDALWIYLIALPTGMLTAVFVLNYLLGMPNEFTQPKLNPNYTSRCIHCGFEPPTAEQGHPADA